jgi:hypothetical protein
MLVPGRGVGLLHHDVGEGETVGDVAGSEPLLGQQVAAGLDLRRPIRERLLRAEHGGKQAILHVDQLERLGGRLRRSGHDKRHGIPRLASPAVHQDRLILQPASVSVVPGDVPCRQDGHDAGKEARPCGVDLHDLGVRMRAPQGPRVQHPLHRQVRRVHGAAGCLLQGLDAQVSGRPGRPVPAIGRYSGQRTARRAHLSAGGPSDGIQDAVVARAATQVATEPT